MNHSDIVSILHITSILSLDLILAFTLANCDKRFDPSFFLAMYTSVGLYYCEAGEKNSFPFPILNLLLFHEIVGL